MARTMRDFRPQTPPAPMALTTWLGMYGNGQTVGGKKDHPILFHGVVRGIALRTIVNLGSAAATTRTTVAAT